MCGICGFVGASLRRGDGAALLDRARDTLTHRGPDDAGSWQSPDGTVALAMRRLSIVDLSEAGHQPMCGPPGAGATLVFNGEIYNHVELRRELAALGYRFRGHSDTEVVLAAYLQWGTDCLSRFVGMFAFALHDQRSHTVFLARDRAGERPLFYTHADGRLTFASEIKALLEDPRQSRVLDLDAFNYYLAFGNGPSSHSLLKGVHKLAPAHALLYDVTSDTLRLWQYWRLPELSPQPAATDESLAEELEQLLRVAVRGQLQADVPVAVMLSGGVDSSIITALAAREAGTVRTFTVTMPTTDHYDEGPYARRVAAHFGTQHSELVAEPASVDLLPALARQFDDPIADSSMVPTYLLSRIIHEHAKVALGGDGADELFGGYPHHRWAVQHHALRRLTLGAVEPLASLGIRFMPMGSRGRNYVAALSGDPAAAARTNQYFDARWRGFLSPQLRKLSAEHLRHPEHLRSLLGIDAASPLRRSTMIDFLGYLPNDILVKIDRASMLTSLEVRAPWLDHRVVEFAFSRVPDRLRATARQGKVLPKILADRLLPHDLVHRRKQGFSIPLHAWFKGEWGEYMTSVLAEAPAELFDARAVHALFRNQRRGLANTQRIFALTMLELWRREYRVSFPAS